MNFSKYEAQYIPEHCQNQKCAILLSGHKNETFFTTKHINELKLYLKIIWFGDNLRYVTRDLLKKFTVNHRSGNHRTFIVAHWTPSEIIDDEIEYVTIIMPKCEEFNDDDSKTTMCKYELTPVLKYSKYLKKATPIYVLLGKINFERINETYLLKMYNNLTDLRMPRHIKSSSDQEHTIDNVIQDVRQMNNANDKEKLYDEIACRFIKENEQTFMETLRPIMKERKSVYIGGMYPKNVEAENEHNGEHFCFLLLESNASKQSYQ